MTGSSPRVWGIRGRWRFEIFHHRFIPTRVGNTSSGVMTTTSGSVHPHACGEYFFWGNDHDLGFGSSPRVWGIQLKIIPQRYWPRFIPTRVGNTPQVVASTTITAVHPHACGEYATLRLYFSVMAGSSPRVWGIPQLGFYEAGPARFIPTRVGNTSIM